MIREGNCTPRVYDGFGEVVPWTGLSTLNRELAFKPPSRHGCGFYCCGLVFWFSNSLQIPQTYVAVWLAIYKSITQNHPFVFLYAVTGIGSVMVRSSPDSQGPCLGFYGFMMS